MVDFAGQGDAHRSMALLWRGAESGAPARTAPGPKPALSVDMIVDAAVAVADSEGMAALSMRSVGERLGRTAMSLYTYVPGKAELLDLMCDRALAELPTDYDLAQGWRAALTAWAEDFCAYSLRHPWTLQVSQSRPVLGPNEYAFAETLARVVGATGLPALARRRVMGTLVPYVRGAARTIVEAREAPSATGAGDEEWWYARTAVLTEAVPDFAERFPALVAMGEEEAASAAGEPVAGDADPALPYLEREARATFAAGIAVLLDGVEAAAGGARK